jgi:glycosyltransferase involved in cell wall biosynthesis
MKIAYVTTYNARDLNQWSGTPYHMTRAFEREEVSLAYVGSLAARLPATARIKKIWRRLVLGHSESVRFNIAVAKNYAQQVARQLEQLQPQAIITPEVNPVAYLNCQQPLILWTDALYAGLLGFYPASANLSALSVQQGNQVTAECLARCRLAIFSSEWAARSAIELYGADKEKVKVVPYGANIECQHTIADIREMLKERSPKILKLLFIGTRWEQKGGPLVLSVAKALHASGLAVALTIVGCHVPSAEKLPAYVRCLGFISKHSPEGLSQLKQLLRESHFLFVPSQSEAYGIVFCEANAYGLPCLSTHVGGISTVIKDNINGMTFARNASIDLYCSYLSNMMRHESQYEARALSSFNEYATRLNWKVATQQVKRLVQEVL